MLVISLGGSVIVPDKVDYKFLKRFRKIIARYSRKEKIVIVTGGGSTFRRYMQALEKEKLDEKTLGLIGMATTKLNARVVAGFFNKTGEIPNSVNDVRMALRKTNIVICGALGFRAGTTTDGNAAEIARQLKAKLLLNITNVKGLYNRDPRKHKGARLISRISFNEFDMIARRIKYHAGQHFVLDQKAAGIIKSKKIKTVIISGRNIKNLERFFKGKRFVGTVIENG